MTKLEILTGYPLNKIRDSWMALGSLYIKENTSIYTKDQIYKVTVETSPLKDCLLFCEKEFIGSSLDWAKASLVDKQYGEISFGSNIISPNFSLLLSKEEFDSINDPVDPSFIPFQEEFQKTSDIIIDDNELNIILTDVGVPFINFDELEYPKQELINNMIKPALQEYFKWFPKVKVVTYPINTTSTQEFEFPKGAYNVVHVGIQQGLASGSTSNTLLRYFDEVVWNSQSPSFGNTGGRRSPRTRTGDWGAMMLDRASRQGMINYSTRIHQQVIEKHGKKYLSCYTNKLGQLQVHYAIETNAWSDIEFARLPEARKLASAYVLKGLGAIRSQAKNDVPGSYDYSSWISRGEDMKKEVVDDWKSITRYAGVIRGSM